MANEKENKEITKKELGQYRLYASEILGTFYMNPTLTDEQKRAEIVAYFILVANRIRFGVK